MTKEELALALARFVARGGKTVTLPEGNAYGADDVSRWAALRAAGQTLPSRKRCSD